MDVTHIPEFGKLKYVHVSVDTTSRVVFATTHTGEKANDVISYCLESWAAWNKPRELKTDNGPAYTSQSFTSFCTQMGVTLRHGLPYNPQGQGIIERAHRTLKEVLEKQKGGVGKDMKPKQRLSLALFTINFLQLDINNNSAADRHFGPPTTSQGFVKWKDVLTGQWKGPDPVITWARGSVCVFPQDGQDPVMPGTKSSLGKRALLYIFPLHFYQAKHNLSRV